MYKRQTYNLNLDLIAGSGPAMTAGLSAAIEDKEPIVVTGWTPCLLYTSKITCFGNFEILVEGTPVKFKFDKTKELLAYLVHRKGTRCTTKEVIATLWEEDGHDSYYRMLKKDLQDALNKLGCGEIIYSGRGQIGLAHLECIQCDYFLSLIHIFGMRK